MALPKEIQLISAISVVYMEMSYACIAMPIDHTFSIIGGVTRSQMKHSSSIAKHAISKRLGCCYGRAYQIAVTKFNFHRIFPVFPDTVINDF